MCNMTSLGDSEKRNIENEGLLVTVDSLLLPVSNLNNSGHSVTDWEASKQPFLPSLNWPIPHGFSLNRSHDLQLGLQGLLWLLPRVEPGWEPTGDWRMQPGQDKDLSRVQHYRIHPPK